MRLSELISALQGHVVVAGGHLDNEVRHLVASNLMSEVLLAEEDNLLMVTALNTEHAVRTADVMGALGVVLTDHCEPRPAMRKTAEDLGVSLVCTPWTREQVLAWAACAGLSCTPLS